MKKGLFNEFLTSKGVFNDKEIDFEVIIVDDCSNDGSTRVIEQIGLSNRDITKTVFHSVNKGYWAIY